LVILIQTKRYSKAGNQLPRHQIKAIGLVWLVERFGLIVANRQSGAKASKHQIGELVIINRLVSSRERSKPKTKRGVG
jgi:hypothetical protein